MGLRGGRPASASVQRQVEGRAVKYLISRFVREQEGQDIIEYALLAAFVSIIAAAVIQQIGTDVKQIYDAVKIQTGNAATAAGS